MTSDRIDRPIKLAGLDFEPEINDDDMARARCAVETMPRLTFIVFKMIVVRRIGVSRAARRLHMPKWCVRRYLVAAIAHIDSMTREGDGP